MTTIRCMVSTSSTRPMGNRAYTSCPHPRPEQLVGVIDSAAHRLETVLEARGLLEAGDDGESDALATDEPLLAACYATSLRNSDTLGDRAGQPSLRLIGEPPASSPSRRGVAVQHQGFSLHVGDQIDGRDRKRLEQLIRYVARPPIATDRLRMRPDGDLVYTLKTPWSDDYVPYCTSFVPSSPSGQRRGFSTAGIRLFVGKPHAGS